MHRRCFLLFNVCFHFLKLINTLVVQVDLQRFRPEFRAFHLIMQQMLAVYDPSWHTLNIVISTTVCVVDMIPRLNLDQHR